MGGDGTWSAGRIAGIPVRVAPSWFLVAALITVLFAPVVEANVPDLGSWRFVVAAGFAVLLYASVLVHELGHALTARAFGLPVRRITLHLLGGVSEIDREAPTPAQELLIAAAGPALSLLLGLGGLAGLTLLEQGTIAHLLVLQLAAANLIVGAFNLLPGLPLDGGRILRAFVWWITGRSGTATVVAAWVGRVVAVLVLLLPFLLPAVRGSSPTIVGVVWSALIAAFVWGGAGQALATAHVRERVPRLSVRALTRRALPVHADLPVAEALRQARVSGAAALVVVDRDGRPIGVVNEAAVAATPDERKPWIAVGDLSRRIDTDLQLSADLVGEGIVDALRANPASEYLVVEDGGAVYGVLVSADVERALTAPTR